MCVWEFRPNGGSQNQDNLTANSCGQLRQTISAVNSVDQLGGVTRGQPDFVMKSVGAQCGRPARMWTKLDLPAWGDERESRGSHLRACGDMEGQNHEWAERDGVAGKSGGQLWEPTLAIRCHRGPDEHNLPAELTAGVDHHYVTRSIRQYRA